MTLIAHTIASLTPMAGTTTYLLSLCDHMARESTDLRNMIVLPEELLPPPASCPNEDAATIVPVSGYCRNLQATFEEREAAIPEVVHDHGQWLPINHASACFCRRVSVPRLVSPHGMLSPWALRHRRIKKAVAWRLYGKADLLSSFALVATSALELKELRALGIRKPIAVVPIGVESRPLDLSKTLGHENHGRPFVLFLSRLHRKKGVVELLDAWRELQPIDWDLILAGPDQEGILSDVALPANVRYVGPVYGEQKFELMQRASLFVLPTYSENFGIVVAESMMAGTPVITTRNAPWECLNVAKCGWWIPMEPQALRSALHNAVQLPRAEIAAMGARAHDYAERTFAWPSVTRKMTQLYSWAAHGTPRPDFVETI